MAVKDPSQAPSLWGSQTPRTPPDTPDTAQVSGPDGGVRGVSGPDVAARDRTPPHEPSKAPSTAPSKTAGTAGSGVAAVEDQTPIRVGPGLGRRLTDWARESFVPPEIWSEDRPSLKKQFDYARTGPWGPAEGWVRKLAIAAFWGVSFPTSVAAYAIEWIGERPSRWITALVLLSLTYQIPYAPEVVGALIRIPAWPITATWAAWGFTS